MTLMLLIYSYSSEGLDAQTVSTMTYNIRYDNPKDGDNWWNLRKDELVELLQYYHPDILGIQEGLHAQVKYIDQHMTRYHYIGVGRDDGERKGEYTAIYYDTTKYSVKYHETFWLSESPTKVSVGWDASMERICTYGHFVHNSSQAEYHIFNAHFDHIGPLARENSASLIVQKIRELNILDKEIIVMGDFNCLPESQPIKAFKTALDDLSDFSNAKIYGPVGTFSRFDPDYIPDGRIDYILSKNLDLQSYRHIDDRRKNQLWPSDHLPVLAKYKLK